MTKALSIKEILNLKSGQTVWVVNIASTDGVGFQYEKIPVFLKGKRFKKLHIEQFRRTRMFIFSFPVPIDSYDIGRGSNGIVENVNYTRVFGSLGLFNTSRKADSYIEGLKRKHYPKENQWGASPLGLFGFNHLTKLYLNKTDKTKPIFFSTR